MENYINIDSGKIWTCVNGNTDGKVILLCNGGPGCCDYLESVSQMLEKDFYVIRFEQRGCGRSIRDGKYDLNTTINDIETIRTHYNITKWIVGGHSWGANLALVYALENPEYIDSILYIAGSGIHNNRNWSEEFHNNRGKIGETIPEMEYEFNAEVNKIGNETLRLYGQKPDFYKKISKLNIETLFLMAENDIRPSWTVEQLYHLMPNAKYICIPNAEHYIWLFNKERLRTELLTFLKQKR